MGKLVDRTGEKYGRLTAISRTNVVDKSGNYRWLCVCDCGNEIEISGSRLKSSSSTKSCGCLKKELMTEVCKNRATHGMSNTRIYNIWCHVKDRCYNKKTTNYSDYGGRGIRMNKVWYNDFQVFYDWSIENGYTDKLSIDRKDNEKGYNPSNCRWATMTVQARNRRPKKINALGVTGVYLHKKGKVIKASIHVNNEYHSKTFSINKYTYEVALQKAIEARNAYEKEYWGDER